MYLRDYCFEKKEDCFSFTEGGFCRCLDHTGYAGEYTCPFYKSKKQFEEDREKYPYNPYGNKVEEK